MCQTESAFLKYGIDSSNRVSKLIEISSALGLPVRNLSAWMHKQLPDWKTSLDQSNNLDANLNSWCKFVVNDLNRIVMFLLKDNCQIESSKPFITYNGYNDFLVIWKWSPPTSFEIEIRHLIAGIRIFTQVSTQTHSVKEKITFILWSLQGWIDLGIYSPRRGLKHLSPALFSVKWNLFI